MTPYEDLAQAIVLSGVKDWRAAVKKLEKRPKHEPSQQVKAECERFFRSRWIGILTSLDGAAILRRLKQEVGIDDE